MQATAHYEFERPGGWTGEIVDMDAYKGELDYFELEVEGFVNIDIDHNYGADADGNRGCRMDFSCVEDITIILDGDFRSFSRKIKDFFRGTLFGKNWESFSDNAMFRFKSLGDEILLGNEQASIEEILFEAVEQRQADDRTRSEPGYDYDDSF
ncbi:hypothetical protein LCGC14_0243880 [marine sediment metagenome]|uniref:Uncharacterized protein n=1 Tax=marine sediment metagenome TaxID=412755 RepID=A0A0F9WRD6_9ZZZZ